MNRCSFCEWIPIVPWRVWPLAGHARLGQNTVVGSMTILLSWLCWGACQEEVCLDPHFLCNLTPPRLSVELPDTGGHSKTLVRGLSSLELVGTGRLIYEKWPRAKSPPRCVQSYSPIGVAHVYREQPALDTELRAAVSPWRGDRDGFCGVNSESGGEQTIL